MPQLSFHVTDKVAAELQRRAKAKGVSVSNYVAEIVRREIGQGWPDGFFEKVVGGWIGEPLERPLQGDYETRENL